MNSPRWAAPAGNGSLSPGCTRLPPAMTAWTMAGTRHEGRGSVPGFAFRTSRSLHRTPEAAWEAGWWPPCLPGPLAWSPSHPHNMH